MTQEALAVVGEVTDVIVRRAPDVVLAEAQKAAAAIKQVIDAKPTKVVMNGETYLEFEDWQTRGRFYGLTVGVAATKYVQFDDVSGWEATATVTVVSTGAIISSADAMCLNDEPKWSSRAKYASEIQLKDGTWLEESEAQKVERSAWKWHKPDGAAKARPMKRRQLVGEESVPMFQLRSMAQTRACAKALRNVLAWVVVMAGYKPTPAEELESAPTPNVERDEPPRVEPEQAAPGGALRIVSALTNAETGALDVTLSTGEVVHAPLSRKKLCAELQALTPETFVVLTISNGVITKMTPIVIIPTEAPGDEVLTADDIFGPKIPTAKVF